MATEKLTLKQELFCQLYASNNPLFGNATRAYGEAYGKDVDDKATYTWVNREATKVLSKPHIKKRCEELMVLVVNDVDVDGELAYVISQRTELSPKVAAIREYNAVKGRLAIKKISIIDDNEDLSDDEIERRIGRIRDRRKQLDEKSSSKRS